MRLMMRIVLSSSRVCSRSGSFDVLPTVIEGEQRPLEGNAHVLAQIEHLVGIHLRDVAEQPDRAGGRLVQPEQVAQQGALAGAGAAHDHHDLALFALKLTWSRIIRVP